jgi:hypothetical protein
VYGASNRVQLPFQALKLLVTTCQARAGGFELFQNGRCGRGIAQRRGCVRALLAERLHSGGCPEPAFPCLGEGRDRVLRPAPSLFDAR